MTPVDKVIILAAGDSTRMGSPKAIIKIKNRTLIETQIDAVCRLNKRPIIVLGKLHDEIRKLVPACEQKAKILLNPDPDQGQFSSLRIGLSEARDEAAFVLPLDTPSPEPEVWSALEKELPRYQVVVPRYLDRGGHPVLLSKAFIKQLLSIDIPPEEQRLDLQIRKLNTEQIGKVSVPNPSITVDLDTPRDLETYFKCL